MMMKFRNLCCVKMNQREARKRFCWPVGGISYVRRGDVFLFMKGKEHKKKEQKKNTFFGEKEKTLDPFKFMTSVPL
jgi:hypothetical protein